MGARTTRSSRFTRSLLLSVLVAAMLFAAVPAFGSGSAPDQIVTVSPGEPAEVLVRFREPVEGSDLRIAEQARTRAHERAGGRNPRALRAVCGLEVVDVPKGSNAAALIARYQADPDVLYAEPNGTVELAEVPNDPLFGQQWALENAGQRGGVPGADISAPDAWEFVAAGSPYSVIVAVLDTGVDYTHLDLADRMWPGIGYDFYDGDSNPMDAHGHGTHIAGTIAAAIDDGFGVAGIAPDAQIMALKVFNEAAGGATISILIEAIGFADNNGARIINASWGTNTQYLSLRDAIAASPALFVAAAGNGNAGVGYSVDTLPFYPASWSTTLDNVISVAGTDRFDELGTFSNYGQGVDIAAPSVDILSTIPGRETLVYHESFADPASWVAEFERETAWGLSDAHFTSAPAALADSPGGDYANDEDSAARMSEPVSLDGLSSATLTFEMLLDAEEGFDGVVLYGSTDRSTWHLLESWSGSTDGQFDSYAQDLTPFAGAAEFWLRFRFSSDETVTASGAYIDDLRIVAPGPASGPSNRHGLKTGTSMAAPHVAGVAALVKSRDWRLSSGELKQVLRDTADPVAALDGVISTGARVNADAAVRAVGQAPPPVLEIAGVNRWQTAVEASQEAFPDGLEPFGPRTVVVATGRNWPDALGGAALAGALGGPVLLVDPYVVPFSVMDEIRRLGAEKAIILGGEVAVSNEVQMTLTEELGPGAVERLAGRSRYETADVVALRVIEELGGAYDGTAFVATGGTYADAVASAPLAAAQGWPLFLAHPTRGLLPGSVDAMVDVERAIILGGELVVSMWVEADLVYEYGEFNVERLAGPNRYATAAAIAEFAVAEAGHSWDRVGIATGQAYPDALAGGVLQGRVGSVMLLTRTATLSPETWQALTDAREEISTVTYFGGTAAVSQAVRNQVEQALQR